MTRLVLVGAGHAHAQVLLDWVRQPVAGVELVLVTPTVLAPYSGMVPGWLAGTYRFDEICIDFAALAAAAGARLQPGELQAIDPDTRRITLASGEVLAYDLLSLNIGSTLQPPTDLGVPLLPLRPLGQLRSAWEACVSSHSPSHTETGSRVSPNTPLRLLAVGGGAAGFECVLAVRARLLALGRPVQATLLSRGKALLPSLAPGAVRAAQRALAKAGVQLRLGTALTPAIASEHDLLLWATGAVAHAWQRDAQRRGSLAVSADGFIRVDAQLRSVSHPQVFAVGDCAAWAQPLPKAGVFAVRMGPVLAAQLRLALDAASSAAPYLPQQQFLVLLATGDGAAIASRGSLSVSGRWVWCWKDHIDRGFLQRFRLPA